MRAILILVILATTLDVKGQNYSIRPNKAFTFSYANDVVNSTDKYYTSGVEFKLVAPIFSKSPFNPRWMKDKTEKRVYHTINFIYDAFTPNLHDELFTGRPFASLMMVGSKHQYIDTKQNISLTSELKLGIIGQATGAGKIQNGLHSIGSGVGEVNGWETQVRNDVAINYIFSVEKQVVRSKYAEIIIGGAGYLGVPYTKVETMVLVRLGIMPDYFSHFMEGFNGNLWIYIFGQANSAYNIYNATLQGGLLNPNSPYVLNSIAPFTLDLQFGVGFGFKKFNLKYGQHLITPEFTGAELYSWGEISFSFLF